MRINSQTSRFAMYTEFSRSFELNFRASLVVCAFTNSAHFSEGYFFIVAFSTNLLCARRHHRCTIDNIPCTSNFIVIIVVVITIHKHTQVKIGCLHEVVVFCGRSSVRHFAGFAHARHLAGSTWETVPFRSSVEANKPRAQPHSVVQARAHVESICVCGSYLPVHYACWTGRVSLLWVLIILAVRQYRPWIAPPQGRLCLWDNWYVCS